MKELSSVKLNSTRRTFLKLCLAGLGAVSFLPGLILIQQIKTNKNKKNHQYESRHWVL